MVGIHNGYKDLQNHNLLNKTIIFQFNKNALTYQNMDVFAIQTKQIINDFYDYNDINLSGDGAKCVNKFSQDMKVVRHYDKFHFHKSLFNCFGFCKNKNKQNKKIFEDNFGNQFPIFLDFLYNRKYNDLENLFKENIIFLKKNNLSNLKISEIKSILRLWKNNKNSLKNTYENNDYLKIKILLNIPKNINVIFV